MIIETDLQIILLIIFSLLLFNYLFFLLKVFVGLRSLTLSTNEKIPVEFISVIIPFRNEEVNILNNLKSIEAQNYQKDKYDVLYVNDSSSDDSLKILNENISSSNVRVISVPHDFSPSAHKKRAIRFGIENSRGEIIVTTDADCTYHPQWLRSLLNYFDGQTAFVSGPVEFKDEENIFSQIQQLEFAGLVLTGAGLVGAGSPTICNAANIAYRRKVFEEVGGFKDQMDLSSGDDELLMQKISKETDYKVKFSVDQKSIVSTPANKSVNEFYQQRKRWASKGLFYRDRTLVIKLILIYLFYLGLSIQLALGFFYNWIFILPFAISFLLKMIIEFKILSEGRSKILRKISLKHFFISELIHVPYITIAGLVGSFGNYFWKERRIKR
ncbi:MAG: glycosyltransferase [Ignavibacteria bacterium]|nr:glycosyltransferase [Ignavibacteria bacterium]